MIYVNNNTTYTLQKISIEFFVFKCNFVDVYSSNYYRFFSRLARYNRQAERRGRGVLEPGRAARQRAAHAPPGQDASGAGQRRLRMGGAVAALATAQRRRAQLRRRHLPLGQSAAGTAHAR